jgi:nitrate/TMAO reductase-like tetraheme cytochrome c subunit
LRPKENFAAARAEMAHDVLAKMKATDSRECRNCHSPAAMDREAQDSSARKKHDPERMLARGETCIDCHKAVGHDLPAGFEE